MSEVGIEFCADCLEGVLKQEFFVDSKECMECGSQVYFRARMKPEVAKEIMEICDRHPIDIRVMTLVFGAAGIIGMEYIDSNPEPMSEDHIFERILEGITGEEYYTYDAQAFAEVIKVIEQNPEIGGEQRQKLLNLIPKLKRAILAEMM